MGQVQHFLRFGQGGTVTPPGDNVILKFLRKCSRVPATLRSKKDWLRVHWRTELEASRSREERVSVLNRRNVVSNCAQFFDNARYICCAGHVSSSTATDLRMERDV